MSNSVIPLCNSKDLQEGDLAVPFDVVYDGQTCRAFAIRFEGQAQAYLNRCSHVAMELDFQRAPCRVHRSPPCVGGPCRGGLVKIELTESQGVVHWHTAYNLKAVEF